MNNKPILILQMQRMGDLILSFPFFSWLQTKFPGYPVWVVAEEMFYDSLLSISPNVVYFPYSESDRLKSQPFSAVINLSHRPEAARLVGELKHEAYYGPRLDSNGNTRISGPWQIYRTSLVHNNRHNRFHWGDLNALDVMGGTLPVTAWPAPERQAQKNARIGLFVGASQTEKRPDPAFFASLLQRLLEQGHKPVILGGPGDRALANKVAALTNTPALNLCGHFSVNALVTLLRSLDLLITPDTGPMHIAAWVGTPVLNLSLGNVSAWETGPNAPGHHIVRSNLSCVGCWSCRNNLDPLACHKKFVPGRIAKIANEIVLGRAAGLKRLQLDGLSILKSARHHSGQFSRMYDLEPISGIPPAARDAFSGFWQDFFQRNLNSMLKNNTWAQDNPKNSLGLAAGQAKITAAYNKSLITLCRDLSPRKATGAGDFWHKYPPFLRPLSSFCQLWLENNDYSAKAFAESLALTEAAILKNV